ncbi:MAG TPA: lmo0937 family membrane protein [Chloroflexota bacterium]|nr:lmo0937 family membrane protein [Chloroflexota bacterium]
MVRIIWTIAAILVALWLIGLVAGIAGGFIHILLIIAIVVVIYNLFVGNRARRV